MAALLNLPTEIIVKILADGADYRTLTRCTQVSKKMRSIIQESNVLQYLIELDIAGFADNPASHLSIASRYDAFKRFQDCWRAMKPTRIDSFPDVPRGTFVFSQGYLCSIKVNAQEIRGVPSINNRLVVLKLPSVIAGTDFEKWEIDLLDLPVITFAVDPSQDLVMLCAWESATEFTVFRFRFLSLRTGEPHQLNTGDLLIPFPSPRGHTTIQICGKHVMVDTCQGLEPRIVVFDWKSSLVKLDESSPIYTSTTFLNVEQILVACSTSALIHAFELRVLEIPGADAGSTIRPHCRTYALPNTNGPLARVWCCSSRIQSCSPWILPSNPPHDKPFYRPSSPSDIVVLCLSVGPYHTDHITHHLFVRTKAFLSTPHRDLSDLGTATTIPWEAWSIGQASWALPHQPRLVDNPSYIGERILAWKLRHANRNVVMQVFDFNLPTTRRLRNNVENYENVSAYNELTSSLNDFGNPISCLPFHVMRSAELPFSVGMRMMDDERIVSIQYHRMDQGKPPHVEVWTM